MDGFWLTYATLEELASRWAETSAVVAGARDDVRADGAQAGARTGVWAPAVDAEVAAFVRTWSDEAERLATAATSVQTRLEDTLATYRAGDDRLAAALRTPTDPPALAGPTSVQPV